MKITEVAPRDGLQNEKIPIETKDKLEFIRLLKNSGIQNIEATSFVKQGAIPQLSDAVELSENLNFQEIEYSCLTPNLKGYESAIRSGFKEIAVFTATSETFTKKNINKTIEESLEVFSEIAKRAVQDKIKVRGYISTIIECPYEGKISPEKVLEITKKLHDLGVYEISLGETIGKGVPADFRKLFDIVLKNFPAKIFAGHYHDTYGMAIANVETSLEYGIRSFDSSSGGLGGCPYARGASGNLATEDLVYLLHRENFETNINLEKLILASKFIEGKLKRQLSSKALLALLANCSS
ncbi:MAG: hydroxymethylglutaryl-CoA lyase [Leptospiraceae bacterium]|nr:hydroxymethylglutaryl-CoA lyase [Leptospiraceae bacterium]NUM40342.1 hydroxymethylglutaryl-CoA lyase [Leptospiraceae bacterium]